MVTGLQKDSQTETQTDFQKAMPMDWRLVMHSETEKLKDSRTERPTVMR
jgi:hypothetical protein